MSHAPIEPITPEDERAHPVGSEAGWSESYRFCLYDSRETFAGRAEFSVRPHEGAIEAGLHFFLPDGGLVVARHVAAHSAASSVLEAGDVRGEMIEPLRRWRLAYDGPSHALLSAKDAGEAEAWRKSRLERLTVELDFEAAHAAIPTSDGSASGFEQAGRWQGVVWVSGDRYEISGMGQRGKSWGVSGGATPDFLAEQRFALWLGEDWAIGARRLATRAGESSGGWIHREGRTQRIERLEISTETDGSLPRAVRLLVVDEDGREQEITGEMLSVAPMRSSRNGVETLDCDGLARFRCGDRAGLGLVRTLHRLGPDQQPLVPIA